MNDTIDFKHFYSRTESDIFFRLIEVSTNKGRKTAKVDISISPKKILD